VDLEISSTVPDNDGDINLSKCERVKACIDSYLEKNSRLTLISVEDKTAVPHSTLRRIMTLKGNPQPEAVIKVFRALGFDQELYHYMRDFHPDIANVMALKTSHNQEYDYVSDSDRQYFVSEDYFSIINMAYTTSGVDEAEIHDEYGRKGVERLLELLEKGLIEKTAEGRYFGKLKNYKLSFADTKKRIELSLRHYRLTEAGNFNNWMSFQTESLNENGLKALKSLQQKHYNDRKDQIFNNPMYSGNLKVYSATVSSTFNSCSGNGELQ
jgi:DNA-binding phage protein